MRMRLRRVCCRLLILLLCIITFSCGDCRGELSETDYLVNFIRTIDPENLLVIRWNGSLPNSCSGQWIGVKCNSENVTEIRLESLNLSGTIEAESLCKLSSLQVLNLAKNHIVGSIPDSISNCTSMVHLNLSSNYLRGKIPASLKSLKNLKILDISNNRFPGSIPEYVEELKLLHPYRMEPSLSKNESQYVNHMGKNQTTGMANKTDYSYNDAPKAPKKKDTTPEEASPKPPERTDTTLNELKYVPFLLVIACFSLVIFTAKRKVHGAAEEKKGLQESLNTMPEVDRTEDIKPGEKQPELVFFVEEYEKFNSGDLFGSAANLQGQSLWSSLYKVTLENSSILAVKRLKKLQVSTEEFRHTMMRVGNLKHPNLLPLVAYHSSNDDKLLIYRYQRKRSLLHLLESYADGKRDFPWKHRLSIASGIAKGLDYIYKQPKAHIIPHGNLKLSNILLGENEEPLISEYGFHRFLDPKRALLYSSNGYIAPEKTLTEKADVFSFGVILLVLLTGKTVERSGLDLIKWVKAMVREEWTGEVFDKEVDRQGKQGAFPLLNISMKCVSHLPENRPIIGEVLEKIEDVVNAQEDLSFSSPSSIETESSQQFGCLLHTTIPEGCETPRSHS